MEDIHLMTARNESNRNRKDKILPQGPPLVTYFLLLGPTSQGSKSSSNSTPSSGPRLKCMSPTGDLSYSSDSSVTYSKVSVSNYFNLTILTAFQQPHYVLPRSLRSTIFITKYNIPMWSITARVQEKNLTSDVKILFSLHYLSKAFTMLLSSKNKV